VTILNGSSVSSSETEVRIGIKTGKHACYHQLDGRKLLEVFEFSNKWSTATLQLDLESDNFNRHPKRKIFKCTFFWLNDSFFSSDDWDILKEEVKTYLLDLAVKYCNIVDDSSFRKFLEKFFERIVKKIVKITVR
jgi:hypothetical protein